MADIQVKSAFVDKVLTGNNGSFGVRTSEPHSRKNDSGGYDTTGRTFRTLQGRNIDWSQFQERDRITFFGREETKEREHEGKKYYDLMVWVDAVAKVAGKSQDQGAANSYDVTRKQSYSAPNADGWAPNVQDGAPTFDQPGSYADETPF